MRIKEIEQRIKTSPPTPQEARLDALKMQKDNVSKALNAERKRQKVAKAQQGLAKILSTKV
jgi:hypothetical protein